MNKLAILSVGFALITSPVWSEDINQNWHQWRGPDGTGVATQGDPPVEWSEEKNVKWKVEIPGRGSSTPIVWGNQIFILTAIKTDRVAESLAEIAEPPTRGGNPMRVQRPTNYHKFVVMSIDRQTGEVLWQDTATEEVPNEAYHLDHGFASASPTTDGKHLYASFGSRGIYCYDLSGQQIWKRDLGEMQILRYFGESISPVLYRDTLIVNWDHEGESFITALDAASGETKWKTPRPIGTNWSTPLVVEHEGRAQVIINGREMLHSYDLETGEVIWELARASAASIPIPIATDDLVFCMTGYPPGSETLYAIPIGAKGELSESQMKWSRKKATPYVPSALLYGETLYFTSSNNAILSSADASTGEPIIERQRMSGLRRIYASPVGVAGRIYITGRDGTTLVINNSAEYEVLATNKLDDSIDASPAIVGDEMFVRGKQHLYCISAD